MTEAPPAAGPPTYPVPDEPAIAAFVAAYRDRTGDVQPISGSFAFGDSAMMADELAGLVLDGPKRATAGAIVEYLAEGEAIPEAGQLWVIHDGSGRPVCLVRTTEVRQGPLGQLLDPAFAWDEGEGDRTYEDWLAGHGRYWRRTLPMVGASFSLELEVALERFAVVWPTPDRDEVLAELGPVTVRLLRHDERSWAADALGEAWQAQAGLPVLVACRGQERVGLLAFRPWTGQAPEVASLDLLVGPAEEQDVTTTLVEGLAVLADRQGWPPPEVPPR